MEPTNQTEQQVTKQFDIKQLLANKSILIGSGFVLIFVILLVVVFSSGQVIKKPDAKSQPKTQLTQSTQQHVTNNSQTVNSAEMQKAMKEAQSADQSYDNWEDTTWKTYPWIRKLPLATTRYYVYFDLDKKEFIGKLYPVTGDNIDQMKTEVMHELQVTEGIPADNFQFEWIVNPQ